MEKLGYQKLMEEHNISIDALPEDAKIGIDSIAQVQKSINMLEKNGKKVSDKVMNKIKANDKWVCGEILEFLDGKHRNNDDQAPHTAATIITEIKKDQVIDETNATDPLGIKIDGELEAAYSSGKIVIPLDELKSLCPSAYDVIFKAYEPEGKNGIETTYYSLLETSKHSFTLVKN